MSFYPHLFIITLFTILIHFTVGVDAANVFAGISAPLALAIHSL